MGGSFDPPHNGHIGGLISVQKSFSLDRIHVIPSEKPPLAKAPPAAPAKERLKMLKEALKPLPFAFADDREIRRGGTSFSYKTVEEIAAARPQDDLFLIIGADQFQIWNRWKNTARILKKAALIVTDRPGFPVLQPLNKRRRGAAMSAGLRATAALGPAVLKSTARARAAGAAPARDTALEGAAAQDGFLRASRNARKTTAAAAASPLRDKGGGRPETPQRITAPAEKQTVYFHSLNRKTKVSSSLVRKRLKEGLSIRSLVPDSVRLYIKSRGLYTA